MGRILRSHCPNIFRYFLFQRPSSLRCPPPLPHRTTTANDKVGRSMLTKKECLVVAERAKTYPEGYGNYWVCDPARNLFGPWSVGEYREFG